MSSKLAHGSRKDFLLTIYGHGSHLGHVTIIISKSIISLYLKAYIQNLVKMAKLFPRKSSFNFDIYMTLD